jgi:hypothetical protein
MNCYNGTFVIWSALLCNEVRLRFLENRQKTATPAQKRLKVVIFQRTGHGRWPVLLAEQPPSLQLRHRLAQKGVETERVKELHRLSADTQREYRGHSFKGNSIQLLFLTLVCTMMKIPLS